MISRPHKNRWYFSIFILLFVEIIPYLAERIEKMRKIRKLLATSHGTNTDIFPAHGWKKQTASKERKIRVHWQTWMQVLCQVQAKSCQNWDFPGKHSVLSHKQEKDISQILFFSILKRRILFICLLLRILSWNRGIFNSLHSFSKVLWERNLMETKLLSFFVSFYLSFL